ncbi:MAG: transposase, partial [Terracidiphilus sp.]
MRGEDQKQAAMYSDVTLAQRVPAHHPARQIRALADRALERLDAELEKLDSNAGRPSIAPERLLRAALLMVLYSIRSERVAAATWNSYSTTCFSASFHPSGEDPAAARRGAARQRVHAREQQP